MSPSEDISDAVDLKELKEIMDDDLELVQDCFADFISEWPAQYVGIKGAVLKKNAQTLNESAHKLKGTLKYLAAVPAADAAYALEVAGKDNDLSGADKKLEHLKNECQKLVKYINNFNK